MTSSELQLNDAISIVRTPAKGQQQQPLEGIVAHLGSVKFGDCSDDWVGVRLTGSSVGLGKNDGSVQGERYFSCGINSGIFVRKNTVVKRALTKLEQLRLRREIAVAKARGRAARPVEQIERNDTNTSTCTDPTISPLSASQKSVESSDDTGVLSTQISDLLSQVTNLQSNLDQVSEKLKTKVDVENQSRSISSSQSETKPNEICISEMEEDPNVSDKEGGGKDSSIESKELCSPQSQMKQSEIKLDSSSNEENNEEMADPQHDKEPAQSTIAQPNDTVVKSGKGLGNGDTKRTEIKPDKENIQILTNKSKQEESNNEDSEADQSDQVHSKFIIETSKLYQQSCDNPQLKIEEKNEAVPSTAAEHSSELEEQSELMDDLQKNRCEEHDEHEVRSQASQFLQKMKVLLHDETSEVDHPKEDIAMDVHVEERGKKAEKQAEAASATSEENQAYNESWRSEESELQNAEQSNINEDKIENERLQARLNEMELYVFRLQSKLNEMSDRLRKKDQETDFLRESLSKAIWDAEDHINRSSSSEVHSPPPKRRQKRGNLEAISEAEEFDADLVGRLEAALEVSQKELRSERVARAAEAEQNRQRELELSALKDKCLEYEGQKINLEKELSESKLVNQQLEVKTPVADKEQRGKRRNWLKTRRKSSEASISSSISKKDSPISDPVEDGGVRWSSRWKGKKQDTSES